MAQSINETTAIQETIISFAKYADKRNATGLEEVLDEKFRLAINQFFGSNDLVIIDKQTYLSKIAAKEFGGDDRTVTIENLFVKGSNASAQATFTGQKMTIITFLQLIKTKDGKWKIINDLPTVL